MVQWVKHLPYKHKIWVEISRTQEKLGRITSVYNSRAPVMRQDVETRESLKARGTASLADTAVRHLLSG